MPQLASGEPSPVNDAAGLDKPRVQFEDRGLLRILNGSARAFPPNANRDSNRRSRRSRRGTTGSEKTDSLRLGTSGVLSSENPSNQALTSLEFFVSFVTFCSKSSGGFCQSTRAYVAICLWCRRLACRTERTRDACTKTQPRRPLTASPLALRANGEFTDDAEVVRPTPPNPPFTRGGKVSRHRPHVHNKTLPWRSEASRRCPRSSGHESTRGRTSRYPFRTVDRHQILIASPFPVLRPCFRPVFRFFRVFRVFRGWASLLTGRQASCSSFDNARGEC